MMDYSGGGTGTIGWPEDSVADQQAATGGWKMRRVYRHGADTSAFMPRVAPPPAPLGPDTGALPGELLTEAVAANLEDRRVLSRVIRKLAGDASITMLTFAALSQFLGALPRSKRLPTVSPDGDGGLTLAWPMQGRGRTLITLAEGTLFVVEDAGTPQATYLPEVELTGTLPNELLALIPE